MSVNQSYHEFTVLLELQSLCYTRPSLKSRKRCQSYLSTENFLGRGVKIFAKNAPKIRKIKKNSRKIEENRPKNGRFSGFLR